MTQHEHPFHYYRSPEEIREVQFSHRVRGLDEYEVAEYLDLLADQVHATNLEIQRLRDERDRLALENERIRAGQPGLRAVPSPSSPDAHPQAASLLLNAQKVADDLVEEAVRRARDMLTVARAEKNAILRNAKEEAAALLVEVREAAAAPLSSSVHSSTSRHSASGYSPSGHSTSAHSASAAQPTPMHLAPQRTWQLDGHAAV